MSAIEALVVQHSYARHDGGYTALCTRRFGEVATVTVPHPLPEGRVIQAVHSAGRWQLAEAVNARDGG